MSDLELPGLWSVAYRQWQGARAYQEDDFEIVEEAFGAPPAATAVLMVLADGMGGEAGGARASRSVVEAFARRFPRLPGTTPTRLNSCLDIASDALDAQVREEPELEGMGSTVVAALYDGRSLSWLSVGDSPMWLFSNGRLTRLNADHSMAPVLDRMVETGEMSSREALADHRRHMLRSAVTGEEVDLIDCAQRSCRIEPGEFLVLASDGLETLAVDRIERLLGESGGDADKAADALMAAVRAVNRAHQDNVTLLVLAGMGPGAKRHAAGGPRTSDTTVVLTRGARSSSGSRRMMAASVLAAGLVAAVALIWWQILDDVPPPPGTATEDGQPGAQPAVPAPVPSPSGPAAGGPIPQGQPGGDSSQAADPQSASSVPAAAPNERENGTTTPDPPAGESLPGTRPKEEEPHPPEEPVSSDPGDSAPKPAGRADPERPGGAAPEPSMGEPPAREEMPPATRPKEEGLQGAGDAGSTAPGDAPSDPARHGDVPVEKASHEVSESARSTEPADRDDTAYVRHRSDPTRPGW